MNLHKRIGFLILLAGLSGMGLSRAAGAETADATITVTPIADVSIELDASTYAFGSVDLNTSTNSATAVRLTNSGDVTVAIEKQILDESIPDGWTAGPSRGHDTYALYCATSTTRLNVNDFGAATLFGAQGVNTLLTGPSGTQPLVPPVGPEKNIDLWFRLDMPATVTTLQSRSITVRFTATAQ
jgi:hypothetical protein